MQISRRAIYATLTGLLTAGAITTVGVTAAYANNAGFCTASSTATTKGDCMLTETVTNPAVVMVTVTVTKGPNQDVSITWSASCTLNGSTAKNFGGSDGMTPTTETMVLPFPDPDSCVVTASAGLSTNDGTVLVELHYAPNPNATAAPTPAPTNSGTSVRLWKGYQGKCLDAAGNGSADRTKAIIWGCNGSDKAQGWTYSGGELTHNGACLNDQRWGGNGSKVILYSCNGAANEIWTHLANGEFVLKANGGKLCLDDPAYATKNGTQLDVWSCHNGTNQRWSQTLP